MHVGFMHKCCPSLTSALKTINRALSNASTLFLAASEEIEPSIIRLSSKLPREQDLDVFWLGNYRAID